MNNPSTLSIIHYKLEFLESSINARSLSVFFSELNDSTRNARIYFVFR